MVAGRKSLVLGSFWIVTLVLGLVAGQPSLALAADEQAAVEPLQVVISFGTGVDSQTRALVGESAEFPSGTERVFCYTRITGADAPTTLTHAWYYKGKTKARVDLKIGASSWRTWSSKRIMEHWVGTWEVKVLDDAGQVLGTGKFEIK